MPPIVASALCIKPRGLRTKAQGEKVDDLKEISTKLAAIRVLSMRFRGLLTRGNIELLNTWLQDAACFGIHAMRQFAATFRRDIGAVRDAILDPWSNGQTEGQIDRLKPSSVHCMVLLASSCSVRGCLPFIQLNITSLSQTPTL
ncbi:transposase [Acidisoma silvae]|uniref:Transposase n=1 Tax=Acidisoma silvae TaxID=2802396 RepID=A0A964E116_9PROT|nr:transposase [Acidisoma silvae]